MYRITQIDRGIHTIEFSIPNLKYSQVQKVNARLTEFGELIPIKADTDNVYSRL